MNNISVSEFGGIRAGILSSSLTAMLCMNALGITLVVGMLEDGFVYPQNIGIAISVLACAGAVLLFFLIKRYLETITYKFYRVEQKRLETIAKIAKRFFTPFLFTMVLDIFLASLGSATLLLALWQKA